jgi:hypothetical protein
MDKTAALAHLDEHGYVVLEGALTPDQADALQSRSYELIEAERAAGGQHIYQDGHSQRVWNLLNKGRIFEEMIQLPQVLDFQSYLLGDDCVLSSYTVNMIGAGADAGQLHIDLPLSSFLRQLRLCARRLHRGERGNEGHSRQPQVRVWSGARQGVRRGDPTTGAQGGYRHFPRRYLARQRR